MEKQFLLQKKKKQIDQIVWRIVCVKEIVGDKARKVGWGQIMEGFEYQTDESELCSVGNGEPLKTLEPPEWCDQRSTWGRLICLWCVEWIRE